MSVAFTEWHGRIAPVFDVAGTVLIVDPEASGDAREQVVRLPVGAPSDKVGFLLEQGVAELVCGAISRPVRMLAEAEGLQVHGFVAGELREVVEAWMQGRLEQGCYSMPGCRRCRCQSRQRSGRNNTR